MGYNTVYKGNTWSYRAGRWLNTQGMLGAIDQTLWGRRGDPPLGHDGTPGRRQREACGSFFVAANYEAGVELLANFVSNYRRDMVQVGDAYITCSWDEAGNMMVIVINHDQTDATYDVQIARRYVREKLPKGATALDLLGEKVIEEDTDGRFTFAVRPGRPAVLFIGAGDVLTRVREAQRTLNAMDMSVPQYFLDRPELNERTWGATPIRQD